MPLSFGKLYTVLILKDKNAIHCTSKSLTVDDFRGISISPVISKIFEHLQFGFKARSSTSQCTFVLKESLAYYINNNSTVYCAFLDATKAFDRVNYCKLFRLI